jgi:glucan 1,3-beta-glucosidase
MIDLHGAPGSQNGYDNSGRRGQALFATDGNNVNRAKNVIQTLSEKYSDPSFYQVVTSLCLLNEPATYLNDQLLQTTRQYWKDSYGAARYPWAPQGSASKSGLALIISDGFQPLSTFNGFMTEPNFETVMIDTHNYQVFDDTQNAWNWPEHLRVSISHLCSTPSDDIANLCPRKLLCQLAPMVFCRRMVFGRYRLCPILEWTRYRCSIRRHIPWFPIRRRLSIQDW